jgi:peroxiredoxin-like protein
MNKYSITLDWHNSNLEDFSYDNFKREHTINFSGEQELINSASPEFKGSDKTTNPEELLAAALASCHMLTFLAITSKKGIKVSRYACRAEALLNKKENGKMAVTEINLFPEIVFYGDQQPDNELLIKLHEQAHLNCFIAQSIQSKVNIF